MTSAATTSSVTPAQISVSALTAPKLGHAASKEKLASVAKQFETSMISSLLQPMFSGLSTAAPFGGGEAEGTLRSFLVDAMAKQVSKAGGLNLSGAIQNELIRMQGGAT
jgi:Rod binding domain-containing protein